MNIESPPHEPAPAEPRMTLVTTPSLLERLAKRRGIRQFVKFGIVGFSGLLVNLIVYTLLQHFEHEAARKALDPWNFTAGFLTGGVSNYFLNAMWTFRSVGASGGTLVQGVKFMTVSAIALVVGLVVKTITTPGLGAGHKTWLLATMAGIVVNFFVNKYWTFAESASPAP